MARSGSCISAIFASTSLSPAALSLLARGGLELSGALLHRGSFLVRESFGRLCGHRGALGRLLRPLRSGFPLSHCEVPPCVEQTAVRPLRFTGGEPGSR